MTKTLLKLLSVFILVSIFSVSNLVGEEPSPFLHAMVVVPQDFDDIEFSTVLDIFKRARIKFTIVGVENLKPTSISGFSIMANRMTNKVSSKDFDLMILLGATTMNYYNQFPDIESLLHDFNSSNKLIGALSMAPIALDRAGLLNRKHATVDPAISGQLSKDVVYVANKAVIDGNIVTSYGPGNAAEFAFLIVNKLKGYQVADQIRAVLYF